MHKKKLLSALLSVALVSTLLPASAFAAESYMAGTYSGSAVVYCDEDEDFEDYSITVDLTVDETGTIGGIEITGYGDTYENSNSKYVSNALNGKKNSGGVSAQLVGQSIETVLAMDNVDIVSGATCTSNAILEAVKAAAATIPVTESIDTSVLQTAINEAEAIENTNYTEDSWSAFSEALSEAYAVIAAPESQEAVDTAVANLINAQEALEEKEAVKKATASVAAGGVNYYYADTTGDDDNTIYTVSVTTGRGPSATTTVYEFTKADMTQAADTAVYYIAAPGAVALTGSLYGYSSGTASSYKTVYGQLGATTEDPAYDAVSSATNFSGSHAKDISSVVTYGTDGAGNKAITGLNLNRGVVSVDAATYVDASVLNAAGYELTEAQRTALSLKLKANPTVAPSENIVTVSLASAAWTTSRYGIGEFAIVPDDTVDGYVWSEYWDNMYAATISNGTTTVGAVHWIDLYGESATSGAHYNKVELAINNGTSVASNAAEVSRYAAFFNKKGEMRPGTYTITLFSEGYTPLTAEVVIEGSENLAITEQPVNWNLADGQEVMYSVTAENAASYKWYYSKDGGKKWYPSTLEATEDDETSSISLKAATSNVGTIYKCKVTGIDGTVAFSDSVGITGVPKIVIEPSNVSFKAGKTATFSVEVNEECKDSAVYQWYYSKDGGTKWFKSTAAGADTSAVSVKMTNSANNIMYYCKVTVSGISVKSDAAGYDS
ncbi:MAG: FMN-binding protein [Lachnospiraceae bacterium]|nr:FMN-binding protein [Lachnospiraceae bacterium]